MGIDGSPEEEEKEKKATSTARDISLHGMLILFFNGPHDINSVASEQARESTNLTYGIDPYSYYLPWTPASHI